MEINEKAKILIVDDNPDNVFLIDNYLRSQGYITFTAESGKDALKILENEMIDLIVLDIMMPEMDGYELCRIIKNNKQTADISVIFLTARYQEDDVIKGFQHGAVDYITKPFNKDELVSRVNTHAELKKSRDYIKSQKELLEKQNKQLVELNATKDKFFSIVAHDLKNPFNTIIGFSRLLIEKNDKLDDKKRLNFLKLVYDSSQQGFNLLANLLEWSRTQTGTLKFQPKIIDIHTIVSGCIQLLSINAQKKGIELNNHIEEVTQAFGDENMITTICRNLLSNALKFTPSGGKVEIFAEKLDETLKVFVSDTGVGIKQDVIENLFNIDKNYTTKGTDDEPGTGLGLVLCKEFVEKNNGEIIVTSEPGNGSTFIFTIPLSGS